MTRPILLPGDQTWPEQVCNNLRAIILVAGLILIDQTRYLWFGTPIFPQIPLVSWFIGFPSWCDWLVGGLMVLSLGSFLLHHEESWRDHRIGSLTFAASFLVAVLLNQHRLQPWGYEFCVLLMVMALLPAPKAVPCLRLVVASIYLHSGLSKLDVTFLTTHGEAFVSVITSAIGWDLTETPVGVRRAVVALLPVGEILVAFGLLLPRTRQIAIWTSVAMHLMLLWILGPWGLGHKPGVLIWNLYFIGQNLLLFRFDPNEIPGRTEPSEPHSRRRWLVVGGYGLVAAVILLPLLEPIGLYDHWPAWAVYASRPERTRVYIAENRVPELPEEIQKFVTDEEPPADAVERFLAGKPAWRRLRIDRWSLEALNAPIYPEDRFHIGVALALAEKYDLGEDLRVEIDGPANRWTGERLQSIFQGAQEIRQAAGQFRFNALPR